MRAEEMRTPEEMSPLSRRCSREELADGIKMTVLTVAEVGVTVGIEAAAAVQQPSTESCCVYFQWPVRQTGWCGLPVEERPDLSTIWDRAEAYSLAIPAFFFCLGAVFTTTYFAVDEATQSTLSWMRPPDMTTFTIMNDENRQRTL